MITLRNSKVTFYGNRGMTLEEDINLTNEYYKENRVYYKSNKSATEIEGKVTGNGQTYTVNIDIEQNINGLNFAQAIYNIKNDLSANDGKIYIAKEVLDYDHE